MGRSTFVSPASQAFIAQIVQLMRDTGGVTKNDIYLDTRLSDRRISQYLRYMSETLDVVHKLPRVGCARDIWVAGPAPKPDMTIVEPDDEIDHAPRRVRVCSTWIPNHMRDPLHAALFGAPQQKG